MGEESQLQEVWQSRGCELVGLLRLASAIVCRQQFHVRGLAGAKSLPQVLLVLDVVLDEGFQELLQIAGDDVG